MPRAHPKYCVRDTTDGVERWYYRRAGQPKVRLPGTPYSAEFMAAYYEARDQKADTPTAVTGPRLAIKGTLRWLCEQWLASGEAKQLDPHTVHVRRLVLQTIWLEPTKEGSDNLIGDMPLRFFNAKVVGTLMDRKAATPEAANNRRKYLSVIFDWAMQPKNDLWASNPARVVKKFKIRTGGYHSWTDDEIEQFRQHHPIGTKARLALEMLLRWSQRRSDIVLFGKQHVRAGWLKFTQFKNRNLNPISLELPVSQEMAEIIAASPCGPLTFLVTEQGKPFTANGFGNKFRDWCNSAGLPHCTSHGLRKAGARQLAERGKSGHEIKAVTGHKHLKEVDRYTEAARQKLLAASALDEDDSGTKVSSQKTG